MAKTASILKTIDTQILVRSRIHHGKTHDDTFNAVTSITKRFISVWTSLESSWIKDQGGVTDQTCTDGPKKNNSMPNRGTLSLARHFTNGYE